MTAPSPHEERPDAADSGGVSPSGGADVRPSDADLDGIEIDILPDGTVRLHARCKPGQDPAECAERLQFLVEALGVPLESVQTEVSEEG